LVAGAEDRALRGRNLSADSSLINGRAGCLRAARPAPAGISSNAQNPFFAYPRRDEKLQLAHRFTPPLIRHLFAQARSGQIAPATVALELGISLSRYYQLRTEYLAACAASITGYDDEVLPTDTGDRQLDGTGIWVGAKRLCGRGTFAWPKTTASGALQILAAELTLLLNGIDLEQTSHRAWWRPAGGPKPKNAFFIG